MCRCSERLYEMILNKEFRGILVELATGLKEQEILWAVIGSTNLVLQGLDVEPNDVDICTTASGLRLFEELFREYVTEPPLEIKFDDAAKYRLKLDMQGIEVDIVGSDSDSDVYYRHLKDGHLVFVEVDGIKIPCFTLKAELAGYIELDRPKRAKIVREFLASKP